LFDIQSNPRATLANGGFLGTNPASFVRPPADRLTCDA